MSLFRIISSLHNPFIIHSGPFSSYFSLFLPHIPSLFFQSASARLSSSAAIGVCACVVITRARIFVPLLLFIIPACPDSQPAPVLSTRAAGQSFCQELFVYERDWGENILTIFQIVSISDYNNFVICLWHKQIFKTDTGFKVTNPKLWSINDLKAPPPIVYYSTLSYKSGGGLTSSCSVNNFMIMSR